jgi:dUTP pyrophosphatase
LQIQERKIVEIVITRPDLIKPEDFEYKTPGSNAFDLKAAIEEPVTVSNTGGSVLIPAGFKMRILDPDYAGVILPRSGMGQEYAS